MSLFKYKSSTRHPSFARDKRGVAAVEFALIVPVLVIMMIGVIEVTRAVSMDRRFGKVTSMVADLLTREESVDAATVQGIYGIVDHIMGVWGTERLKLHITPVRAAAADPNDVYVYAGTANRPSFGSSAASPRNVCDRFAGLTLNLLQSGTTAIVVEGEFEYEPLIAQDFVPTSTWLDRAVFSPRNAGGQCVSFEKDENDTPICEPTPSCE
jgi:Flp pilus assembly protein TadG